MADSVAPTGTRRIFGTPVQSQDDGERNIARSREKNGGSREGRHHLIGPLRTNARVSKNRNEVGFATKLFATCRLQRSDQIRESSEASPRPVYQLKHIQSRLPGSLTFRDLYTSRMFWVRLARHAQGASVRMDEKFSKERAIN